MKDFEIKNGLLMLASFIGFFFVMKLLGLYENMWLRVFNFAIHGAFVYMTVKKYFEEHGGQNYLPTFASGFRASFIGVIGFTLFQMVYLSQIDPEFMTYIQNNAIMGNYLTPVTTSIFIFIEGISAGILASYISMRYVGINETKHAGL